jgi:hypothetical protein
MKLNSRVLLIVVSCILVIALVVVGVIYFQQVGERRELNERLDEAQIRSDILKHEKEGAGGLDDQLGYAQSRLYGYQRQFPQAVESIEYGEDFFRIAYGQNLYTMAAGCGVELTSLTATKPSGETIGAVTYSISSFSLAVQGGKSDILKFIDAIGTGIDYKLSWKFQEPWSVRVNSVTMNVAGGAATINLDVYGYKR